ESVRSTDAQSRSRSASTSIRTSSSNEVLGVQPSLSLALEASPTKLCSCPFSARIPLEASRRQVFELQAFVTTPAQATPPAAPLTGRAAIVHDWFQGYHGAEAA